MLLNYPEAIPLPLVHGKIIFHKICLWCQKKIGDHWIKESRLLTPKMR